MVKTAGGTDLIPGRGTKILYAKWCSQGKKKPIRQIMSLMTRSQENWILFLATMVDLSFPICKIAVMGKILLARFCEAVFFLSYLRYSESVSPLVMSNSL